MKDESINRPEWVRRNIYGKGKDIMKSTEQQGTELCDLFGSGAGALPERVTGPSKGVSPYTVTISAVFPQL